MTALVVERSFDAGIGEHAVRRQSGGRLEAVVATEAIVSDDDRSSMDAATRLAEPGLPGHAYTGHADPAAEEGRAAGRRSAFAHKHQQHQHRHVD